MRRDGLCERTVYVTGQSITGNYVTVGLRDERVYVTGRSM